LITVSGGTGNGENSHGNVIQFHRRKGITRALVI
jgi:hypothetical protein